MGQDVVIDLDTVADELYALAPPEFTSRRDARAAEARKAGDKALAAEIKRLRRPTTGAWLANLLARQRSDQVGELLDLGTALRQAQATLAIDDLRRLSQERHRVLTALSREARDLASQGGQVVSDAVAKEVEATLEAALADADAGDALRAGRLTTGLHYSGLGLVGDLSGDDPASATTLSEPPGGNGERGEKGRRSAVQPDEPGSAEQEQVLLNAQAALAEAEWDAGQKQRRLEEVQEERDRYQAQMTEMEQQLQALRDAEAAVEHKLRAAREALGTAQNGARAARADLERARTAAGNVSPRSP